MLLPITPERGRPRPHVSSDGHADGGVPRSEWMRLRRPKLFTLSSVKSIAPIRGQSRLFAAIRGSKKVSLHRPKSIKPTQTDVPMLYWRRLTLSWLEPNNSLLITSKEVKKLM
jgi:hypothetical protein